MRTNQFATVVLILVSGRAGVAGMTSEPPRTWAVRIVFGTDDKEPTDWTGKVAGPADLLDRVELEPWRFATGQGDQFQPKERAWKVQTRLGIAPFERTPVAGANNPPAGQIPWPVGVTIIGSGLEPDRSP